jgi:hypothetical protein
MTEPAVESIGAAETNGSRGAAPVRGMSDQLRVLWTYVIPAASTIGLFVYGMLRQLYAHFYGSLGASPEEVGLGYSETLALSGIAVLWVLVLPPALVMLALRLVPRRRQWGRPAHHWVRMLAPPLAAVLLVLGAALLVSGTWEATGRAYEGRAVTSVNISEVQVLGLRAEPATVWWKGDRQAVDPGLTSGECLLYLGQANGITVLYDPGPPTVRTIRVQTSDVVVEVDRAERQPGQRGQRGGARCEDHRLVFS